MPSASSSSTDPAMIIAKNSLLLVCNREPLVASGRIVTSRASNRFPMLGLPSDSICERDQPLCSTSRLELLTNCGPDRSAVWKNSPKVTPSPAAIRSSEASDGEALFNSTCEMKLGENPHLLASVRADTLSLRRRRRRASPRDCSRGTVALGLFFAPWLISLEFLRLFNAPCCQPHHR